MKLRDVLKQLPDTPEKIAVFMKAEGIQGYLKSKWSCPLARWLKAMGKQCSITADAADDLEGDLEMLPYAARRFVMRFDLREWPELIDPSDVEPARPGEGTWPTARPPRKKGKPRYSRSSCCLKRATLSCWRRRGR